MSASTTLSSRATTGTGTFICITCGTQFPPSDTPPLACPICEDERQYIGHAGQRWTSLTKLQRERKNAFRAIEPGLTGIGTEPAFAIGQQAHLIETTAGNVLWDCISLIDDATVAEVERRGGIAAIVISHPHFFSSMAEWSAAFGDIPIYLHADHRPFVVRTDAQVSYWDGETREIVPGVTAIRCGGHYPGSSVLHWAAGANGGGSLFTGDTIYVVQDRRWVSFMYSYPNLIPLDATTVNRIVAAVEPFAFDRLHSSWHGAVVASDAKNAVSRSAARYIAHISPAS